MSDTRELLQRGVDGFEPMPDAFERVLVRRDRKRRNQRIAAGVVGIAVFVAAIWVVTSVGSLDRSETSVVPGQDVTGPAETGPVTETGPAETAQPPGPPYGEPDVGRRGECSPGQETQVGLELWDLGDRIRVRFALDDWPGSGHTWRVVLGHTHIPAISPPEVVFRGTRVPKHSIMWSKRFKIIRYVTDLVGVDEFQAKAVDTQTDQVCRVNARI